MSAPGVRAWGRTQRDKEWQRDFASAEEAQGFAAFNGYIMLACQPLAEVLPPDRAAEAQATLDAQEAQWAAIRGRR